MILLFSILSTHNIWLISIEKYKNGSDMDLYCTIWYWFNWAQSLVKNTRDCAQFNMSSVYNMYKIIASSLNINLPCLRSAIKSNKNICSFIYNVRFELLINIDWGHQAAESIKTTKLCAILMLIEWCCRLCHVCNHNPTVTSLSSRIHTRYIWDLGKTREFLKQWMYSLCREVLVVLYCAQ